MRRGPEQTREAGWNPTASGSEIVIPAPGLGFRIVVTKCGFSLGDATLCRFYVQTASSPAGGGQLAAFMTGGRNMHLASLLRSDEKPYKCLENEAFVVLSSVACSQARIFAWYYIEKLL